jgi:hypothetical protein
MNALERRDEFAADTRRRLPPGRDDGRLSNNRRSLSRERDLDRTVSDIDVLDGSLDQPTPFGGQCGRGG